MFCSAYPEYWIFIVSVLAESCQWWTNRHGSTSYSIRWWNILWISCHKFIWIGRSCVCGTVVNSLSQGRISWQMLIGVNIPSGCWWVLKNIPFLESSKWLFVLWNRKSIILIGLKYSVKICSKFLKCFY